MYKITNSGMYETDDTGYNGDKTTAVMTKEDLVKAGLIEEIISDPMCSSENTDQILERASEPLKNKLNGTMGKEGISDPQTKALAEMLDRKYEQIRERTQQTPENEPNGAKDTKYSRLEKRADGRIYVKSDFPELPTQEELNESEPTQMIIPQRPEEYGESTQAISPIQEYGEPTEEIPKLTRPEEPTEVVILEPDKSYSEQTIEYAIKPEVIEEGLDSESQPFDKGVHEALEELLAKEQKESPIEITDLEEIKDDFYFPGYS